MPRRSAAETGSASLPPSRRYTRYAATRRVPQPISRSPSPADKLQLEAVMALFEYLPLPAGVRISKLFDNRELRRPRKRARIKNLEDAQLCGSFEQSRLLDGTRWSRCGPPPRDEPDPDR